MEAHEQVKNGNVLKFVKNYWFILVFIVGVAIAWSQMQGTVIQHGKDIFDIKVDAKEVKASVNDLDKKYIEDITFIKTKLLELSK